MHETINAPDHLSLQELSMSESILGFPLTKTSRDICIKQIMLWLDGPGPGPGYGKYFVCANPHSLEIARTDPHFDLALKYADFIVPDGIGIVLASRVLGGSIRKRVTGTDIFLGLSSALNRGKRHSYFFLGSTEQNLMEIKNRMSRDFPNIRVAGIYAPPFKPEFSKEDIRVMIKAVNEAKPDVLWVGMTAPKQEKWIYQNKNKLDVKFIGAIGAAFDFYTGAVKRPHPFFQKIGLEWLIRLIQNPLRLWKRNLISSPRFMLRVINSRIIRSLQK